MAKRIKQRHDALFQRLLDQPEAATALLRERLPNEVVQLLIDEPPEPIPGSFISKRLRGYRTDRLFRTRTIDGKPVFIYCLLEHKSQPDPHIAWQLLGYQYQILDYWQRTEGKKLKAEQWYLPAILTMVVYHGVGNWNVPLSLLDVTNSNAALHQYLLNFKYSLVNLGHIPDENLSKERSLRVGFLILKHGNAGWVTREQLIKLFQESMRLGNDDLITLIYYLLNDLEEPFNELINQVLNEMLPDSKESVMETIADKLKLQGKFEGKLEGKLENQIKNLLRLLERRFRNIPKELQQRIYAADINTLELWFDRAIDATTLDQVFF